MSKTKLSYGVARSIEVILATINGQRSYQGHLFGHKSIWATITMSPSHGAEVTSRFKNPRGINASRSEIKEALEILQKSEDFSQYISVDYIDDNRVALVDNGYGVLSEIKFDTAAH